MAKKNSPSVRQDPAFIAQKRAEQEKLKADVAAAVELFRNTDDDDEKFKIWDEMASLSLEHAAAMHKCVARDMMSIIGKQKAKPSKTK